MKRLFAAIGFLIASRWALATSLTSQTVINPDPIVELLPSIMFLTKFPEVKGSLRRGGPITKTGLMTVSSNFSAYGCAATKSHAALSARTLLLA